ncbi:hypothetical protein DICSQDRAFT_173521 [Dichomitus squalens LYAD-421 SS1]|uniref:DUF8212 domain-containing protein n=1 Tax=Dichomitus squalens (strain LYAD-421) TaxID=732165 RepID=R7SNX2_DICSQ|nr:uncharacterized protein DICSQDRAFT_173521 [Dichomitus squalens LYAD-421 SS1]EJF57899.1 hypothetical protein DICSQDRAFT_173521 [Dichomitus squalens LYAD-421 SS1]
MPTLYGEGHRALRRLQEEVLRRTPDQSIFAWGSTWKPSSDFHEEPDDASSVPRDKAYQLIANFLSNDSLITTSLKRFQVAHTIGAVPYDEVRLRLQLYGFLPTEWTFTSYGIRTQLPVLRLSAILHPDETEVPDDHPMSHWYLAILGCEHGDHPGHLLGRVCHILPSKSGVDLLYAGWITLALERDLPGPYRGPDMLASSPATIEDCHSQIELRTVYISHPSRPARRSETYLDRFRSHSSIFLTLSRETRGALRAQQYNISLQRPDQAHPTTHRLTLSRHDHTISIQYDHTLKLGGEGFTMRARVESPSEVTWCNFTLWSISLGDKQVTVRAGEELAINLDLTLLGPSWYAIRVGTDRHSDATPTVESRQGEAPGPVGPHGNGVDLTSLGIFSVMSDSVLDVRFLGFGLDLAEDGLLFTGMFIGRV